MAYGFSGILGWGVFWIALIAGIALFAIYRRLYIVFYLITVALYIFTAGFVIDVFELRKLGILTTLIFSAVLFMVAGWYLSKVFHQHTEQQH